MTTIPVSITQYVNSYIYLLIPVMLIILMHNKAGLKYLFYHQPKRIVKEDNDLYIANIITGKIWNIAVQYKHKFRKRRIRRLLF
jgi:hypothetical protein